MNRLLWMGVLLLLMSASEVAFTQIRGGPEAVAAAERVLERSGGREAWGNARSFYVEERAFLRSGEVAELKIWRDFETGNRRLERVTNSGRFSEWLAADTGWEVRNGVMRVLAAEELAIELQGLRQEPYAIYRRVAKRDPALRVELRDQNTLYVYDRSEQVLCWFLLDGVGSVTSWGNFWNGAINQHYYGPTADMGDANLPKWGVSSNGNFRFEYRLAKLTDQAVEPPTRPQAVSVPHQSSIPKSK